LNLRVLSTLNPFSHISRPAQWWPGSTPISFQPCGHPSGDNSRPDTGTNVPSHPPERPRPCAIRVGPGDCGRPAIQIRTASVREMSGLPLPGMHLLCRGACCHRIGTTSMKRDPGKITSNAATDRDGTLRTYRRLPKSAPSALRPRLETPRGSRRKRGPSGQLGRHQTAKVSIVSEWVPGYSAIRFK